MDDDIKKTSNPSSDQDVQDILAQEDVALDDVLKTQARKPQDEAALQKKKKLIKYGSIGGACLLVLFLLFSCQPSKGPMEYGVCSVFLEMNTPYPHTLNYTAVEGSATVIRIYYTSVDPFGQYKEEMIECKYRSDKWELAEINKNRRPVDPQEVKKFNMLIPSIVESDPYRVMPPNWENPLTR